MCSIKQHQQPSTIHRTPRNITLELFHDDTQEFITEPSESKFQRSPLRRSLQTAITKIVKSVKRKSKDKSPSRQLTPLCNFATPTSKASDDQTDRHRQPLLRRNRSQIQQDKEILNNMHPQTMDFLKKYFSGCNSRCVTIQLFLEKLLINFQNLWDEQQALTILPQIVAKLRDTLGYEYLNLPALDKETSQGGLMGMLLRVLQGIEKGESDEQDALDRYSLDPQKPELQNILNIIQEFTEGLYKQTEKMLYSKLNGLMRKLVLKHREVDNLLSRLNDKITENSDILEQDKLLNQTRKCYEEVISDLRRKISSMESTSAKECLIRESLRVENQRLEMENARLNETIERFQNHLMKSITPSDSAPTLHHDRLTKSPLQPKSKQKEHINELENCIALPHQHQHKCHELAATRFRSNTCYLQHNIPCVNVHQIEPRQTDGPNRTPQRFRKNADAQEFKKGISSIMTEKQNPKHLNPITEDQCRQIITSKCPQQFTIQKTCDSNYCRKF